MEDKLFCVRCGYRIWKHADERPFVDFYIQDQHVRCENALAVAGPKGRDGKVDTSYVEVAKREEVK